MSEAVLLRAQSGDSDAFAALVRPYRRELQVHCYRMLGSVQDAEDVLQEALLSAWQALGAFDGRALRAWLYRIATNRCLNHLRAGRRRPQTVPLPEPSFSADEAWWVEPYPDVLMEDVALGPEARYDARESIALSFVSALQQLPAQQRAVLVLRDVLGFSASECAEILDGTATSVSSALARARAGLSPTASPEHVPLPHSQRESQIVGRFVAAFEQGDLDELVTLLTGDARLSMPPEPGVYVGPAAIEQFLDHNGFRGRTFTLVPTRANSQPAFGEYHPVPGSSIARTTGLLVLTLTDEGVSGMTRFADTSVLARFGLPSTLRLG